MFGASIRSSHPLPVCEYFRHCNNLVLNNILIRNSDQFQYAYYIKKLQSCQEILQLL